MTIQMNLEYTVFKWISLSRWTHSTHSKLRYSRKNVRKERGEKKRGAVQRRLFKYGGGCSSRQMCYACSQQHWTVHLKAASKPPLLPKTLTATMNFKETFLDFLTKFKRTNNLGINSKSRQAQNENFWKEWTTAPEEQRNKQTQNHKGKTVLFSSINNWWLRTRWTLLLWKPETHSPSCKHTLRQCRGKQYILSVLAFTDVIERRIHVKDRNNVLHV